MLADVGVSVGWVRPHVGMSDDVVTMDRGATVALDVGLRSTLGCSTYPLLRDHRPEALVFRLLFSSLISRYVPIVVPLLVV